MTYFIKKTLLAFGVVATLSGGAVSPVFANSLSATVTEKSAEIGGSFTKKKYKISGEWSIIEQDGQRILRLSESFKTKNGPDLKVFLSPKSIKSVTGKTATEGAVQISVLKANKGAQDYVIPDAINLSSFQSVLIHCEAYSVLWGGSDL